jgi:hypothetical protein
MSSNVNSIFLKSLYDDFCGNIVNRILLIIYLAVTSGTISYGTYCMTLHKTEDSCPIVFATGIILLLLLFTNIIIILLAVCTEEKSERITRNPLSVKN